MNIQKTIIITKHPHIDCLVSKKKNSHSKCVCVRDFNRGGIGKCYRLGYI